MRDSKPTDRLIVALDHPRLADALALAKQLRGLVRTVKIGSALFTAEGPRAVERLRALRLSVMLDLKFFDIPNTVELSCRAAAGLGVSLLTVHAAGDAAMLKSAVRGARAGARARARPSVLAVTVLTSTAASSAADMTRSVVRLARHALESGCDGVVASAQEAGALRRAITKRFTLVCPGIRPAEASRADQRRIATPAQALRAGADLLVVGRPITEAADPRCAAQDILNAMETAHAC